MSDIDLVTHDAGPFHGLRISANTYFDLQEVRIRIENRINKALAIWPEMFAVDDFSKEFDLVINKKSKKPWLEHRPSRKSEHEAGLELVRRYRKVAPSGVRAWQKEQRGIGEHLTALLLGQLGHPRIATPYHWEGKRHATFPREGPDQKLIEDVPYWRTRAQLRQYCGHGDPKRKAFSGMAAADAFKLGSPKLKKIVHQLSEACVRQPGTPINVLLGRDNTDCDPHTTCVEAEDPSTANGDHSSIEFQTSRVAVDGISSKHLVAVLDRHLSIVNGDHRRIESHGYTVAVDGISPTSSDQCLVDSHSSYVAAGGTPRYRLVYEQRRLATVDRLHDGPCVRCGPSGRPASDGSPWSAAHQQADGLRIVGKEILNDLWEAAGT